MRRVCCVQCGVHSGLSWYQSNYASCNAQMNTNDCDDGDNNKFYYESPTYCPERHSCRQRRSHIEGNSSRGMRTLKDILLRNIFFINVIIIHAILSDCFLNCAILLKPLLPSRTTNKFLLEIEEVINGLEYLMI